MSIKSKDSKLNLKCWKGYSKNEECNIYSNGCERFACGTDNHYDIIYAPYLLCKNHHRQKIRIFNYINEREKLYLGEGDKVYWSDGIPYQYYTGVPFKDSQWESKARSQFSIRYHYHNVLLRVCLFYVNAEYNEDMFMYVC